VRQAIADPDLLMFLDALVVLEIAPALTPLDVAGYWRTVKTRFANPMIDHRLAQIAEDGSLKLPQRLFPLLESNIQSGREFARMGMIVRAWLQLMATAARPRDPANAWLADWAKAGADPAKALDMKRCFPPCSAPTRGCATRSSTNSWDHQEISSAAHRGATCSIHWLFFPLTAKPLEGE